LGAWESVLILRRRRGAWASDGSANPGPGDAIVKDYTARPPTIPTFGDNVLVWREGRSGLSAAWRAGQRKDRCRASADRVRRIGERRSRARPDLDRDSGKG